MAKRGLQASAVKVHSVLAENQGAIGSSGAAPRAVLSHSLVALCLLSLPLSLGACSSIGSLFGGNKEKPFATRVTALGVNGYLWQAALDTLAFMPLQTVDAGAGLILSDWYASPNTPSERVKVGVRFLSPDLRSDALRVTVLREVTNETGWVQAPVQASTALQIEEAILTQARKLRIKLEG